MPLTRPIQETPDTALEAEGHKLAVVRDFNPKPAPNPGHKNTSGSAARIAGTKVGGSIRISGGTT